MLAQHRRNARNTRRGPGEFGKETGLSHFSPLRMGMGRDQVVCCDVFILKEFCD